MNEKFTFKIEEGHIEINAINLLEAQEKLYDLIDNLQLKSNIKVIINDVELEEK